MRRIVYELRKHPVTMLFLIALGAIGVWNLGGAYLWRSLARPIEAVPLRLLFANEGAASIKLLTIRLGAEQHTLDFDLPPRSTQGSFFLDFAQRNYVEQIEVVFRSSAAAEAKSVSLTTDARRHGECESHVSFGKDISGTVTVSECERMQDTDSVPWDPMENGPEGGSK
jgi:hypothetical protein